MKKNIKREGLRKKIFQGIYNLTRRKTFKNKMYAICLELIGIISVPLLDNDITVLIFMQMFAIPLFISKENAIT